MLNRLSLNKLSLNRVDLNRIGGRDVGVSGRPYIDPELLSHVKMAISTWGKANDDPDRAVLKDLSGNGNDMRLLNFGFAEGSGYGLYGTDFSKNWILTNPSTSSVLEKQTITFTRNGHTGGVFFAQIHNSTKVDIPSFKVNVDFYPTNNHPNYYYWDEKGVRQGFPLNKGINVLPANYASKSNDSNLNGSGFHDSFNETVTIEQLPDFEGWLCTDGVDDIIESVNPVSEMLEGSNEITVVSIIHQISQIPGAVSGKGLNNQISYYDSPTTRGYLRNNVKDIGKTGIYGYTFNGTTHSVINNILGDKGDYIAVRNNEGIALNGVFSVCGYKNYYGELKELSSVAYAGGFLANKVLTTDEINQIIAYYNLDRPGQIIKPQLYCNVKKQGITNDNHAEFNDQLIDFVGGHNIQLNNVAWEGESGINSYPVVFGANKTWETYATYNFTGNINGNKLHITKVLNSNGLIFSYVKRNNELLNIKEIPSFDIEVIGLEGESKLQYYYLSKENAANIAILTLENGVHKIPKSFIPTDTLPNSTWIGFRITPIKEGVSSFDCDITIEVLPTIENALCLDGISDFGKATGLPVLKDYTVVADRKIETINGGIISKSYSIGNGAFIFELTGSAYSFGNANVQNNIKGRMISYMSKYSYNGNSITPGTGIDGDTMWLATIRDNYINFSKFALWSLMLFPYSLSEFLLERQLKKYKIGTLYPDMVEFRPIVKSNIPYSSITYSVNPGEYITEGSTVTITVTLSNETDKLVGVSSNAISDISISGDNGTYEITGKVTKSPQKISIAIDEYIRYEDIIQPYPFVVPIYDENDNLISWGDKLRVGSTIRYQRVYNLIPELYLADIIYYNGNVIDGTGGTLIAEKEMVFSNRKTWLLSTAEPLFIYDPSMINNVGLQNLGYLPDLTGQRRHLKLNNMAYDEESGIGTDGALHYDGVDDHGIVQSLSHGGKCLITRLNWQFNQDEIIIYDQRKSTDEQYYKKFALDAFKTSDIAYGRRLEGNTYIDNVLNNYIKSFDLEDVDHVVTIICSPASSDNTNTPIFGKSILNLSYSRFAMHRTILLSDIPSNKDRAILNEWCGIKGGYVEKPEYYWDAHGKTNADPDRNTIKNRGTEQSLISNSSPTNLQTDWIANEFTFVNSASDVDIMSGDRLASTAYEARFLTGQVIPAMQVTLTLVNSAYDTFSYMYVDEEGSAQRLYFNDLVLNEPVTVDLPTNNNNNTNTGFILEANNPNAVINVKVLSQSVNIENAFDLEANNLAYTDESGYKENGLYLNGVDDSLVNPNVPAFTDYTYIIKREILANDTINSVTMHKGLVKEFAGGFTVDYVIDDVDNFVYHSFGRGNVVSRKSVENSIIYGITTSVNGITINRGSNTDDNSITIGKYASNYRKMIFCKLALFSKTIDMLSINMLRNLFKLDEIIDLNNKLFKK